MIHVSVSGGLHLQRIEVEFSSNSIFVFAWTKLEDASGGVCFSSTGDAKRAGDALSMCAALAREGMTEPSVTYTRIGKGETDRKSFDMEDERDREKLFNEIFVDHVACMARLTAAKKEESK